ncbi:hypothetical protein MPL3365_130589 [Mesorhizobium plurifarium]|uniref:Integrase n=1 Tax=Mesorhizobium plurifarium TaxID=69974 RepID=A0A090FX21_MESPL|nr:hypothetical protein MPL3365_130589 [Mesorhizobium plurifarium]
MKKDNPQDDYSPGFDIAAGTQQPRRATRMEEPVRQYPRRTHPLKPRQIWAIRFFVDRERRLRDRALFDLAIDSKLRGCDLVRIKIGTLVLGPEIRTRAQQKTGRPVQFELMSDERSSLLAWLEWRGGTVDDYAFQSEDQPQWSHQHKAVSPPRGRMGCGDRTSTSGTRYAFAAAYRSVRRIAKGKVFLCVVKDLPVCSKATIDPKAEALPKPGCLVSDTVLNVGGCLAELTAAPIPRRIGARQPRPRHLSQRPQPYRLAKRQMVQSMRPESRTALIAELASTVSADTIQPSARLMALTAGAVDAVELAAFSLLCTRAAQ